ncbi:Uncharacterized [Moorella glycerini]|uniref:DUF3784 domain-containing protein n=1 Tax=Neomoorella stamsii TaxID=1266720 RepID=A0A9X7P534_9FIRM|nr:MULTISPECIES: hypothetical protein [Moorella]PRR69589.1 hypothetical protein MOST_30110 [Moorella stamsii]CEP67887.1 Uncharacterized [Moorella glycerini]CEP68757.1 Uncharacterized [Moorella glycerini]
MMLILLVIIVLLLSGILMSHEKERFERFFEKNALPNGEKVNIYIWAGRAIVSAFIVMFATMLFGMEFPSSLGWFFVVLIVVSWLGPYVEYAIAWNFYKPTDNKTDSIPSEDTSLKSLLKEWWQAGKKG